MKKSELCTITGDNLKNWTDFRAQLEIFGEINDTQRDRVKIINL